jgi:hypothetical protein
MEFNILIANIQWIPVIIITLLSFGLGFIWHSSAFFGKLWKKENYPNGMPDKINAPLMFGATAIFHFVALIGLSAITSQTDALNGFITGALISLIWILPAMGGTYLFANRSVKLLAIDFGMYLILFSLSGLFLGIW